METQINNIQIEQPEITKISKKKYIIYGVIGLLILAISIAIGYFTACNKDSNNTNTKEELPNITQESVGTLYLLSESEYIEDIETVNRDDRFVFKDSINNTEIDLTDNIYIKDQSSIAIYEPILINNSIYYLSGAKGNEVLRKLEIFSTSNTVLDIPFDRSKVVHSFFIHEDTIYYLTGEYCNYYMGECSLDLYSYNTSTKEQKLLASELASREIVGFESSKTKLILRFAEGDADCEWMTYEQYDISTEEKSLLGTFSYCTGEESENPTLYEENQEEFEQAEAIKNSVVGITTVNQLIIEKGEILFPTDEKDEDSESNIPIRVVS